MLHRHKCRMGGNPEQEVTATSRLEGAKSRNAESTQPRWAWPGESLGFDGRDCLVESCKGKGDTTVAIKCQLEPRGRGRGRHTLACPFFLSSSLPLGPPNDQTLPETGCQGSLGNTEGLTDGHVENWSLPCPAPYSLPLPTGPHVTCSWPPVHPCREPACPPSSRHAPPVPFPVL